MHRIVVVCLAFTICSAAFTPMARAADPPADRVVAMYFHRTERCPTCLKMGSYAEEAVNKGFAEQVQSGLVAFHYIDFQDRKNAAFAKAYKVSGPALVIVKVADNKVEQYKNLQDIWGKVREKPEFLKYVQTNIQEYLQQVCGRPGAWRPGA